MKKFFAISLALVMVLALSVTCFAATVNSVPYTETQNVTVSYNGGADAPATYAIDVAWQALSFTYTASGKVWDSVNHVEKDVGTSGWVDADAEITITNHSNREIKAAVVFTAGTASGTAAFNVTGGAESTLAAAAGATVATKTATLTASGIPDVNATNAVVGTVTVTIAAVAAAQ